MNMTRRGRASVLLSLVFFCLSAGSLWAQEEEKKKEKEEEPYELDLNVDIGFPRRNEADTLVIRPSLLPRIRPRVGAGWNWLYDTPSEMDLRFWPSNTWHVAMGAEFPVKKLKAVVVPMLGLSGQHYRFDNDITLATDNDRSRTVPVEQFVSGAQEVHVDRSSYNLTYLDLATEIRLYPFGNFSYRNFSFIPPFFAIGGFAGYLLNSRTGLRYTADGVKTRRAAYTRNYHTPNFQYGVYGKIGFGPIHLFYRHNLSTLFEKEKGPFQTQARNGSAGIEVGF